MIPVTFYADRKHFRTRATDGANLLTFETGEYQKDQILEVVKLPDDVVYKVTVEVAEEVVCVKFCKIGRP